MPADVFSWWVFLGTVSALNVLAWSLSALGLERRRPALDAEVHAARRLQLLLSAGYVLGCAFRSAFPVLDVPRLCLSDSWLSSVIVGRSVATIAELCFAAQCALLLGEVSRVAGNRFGRVTTMAVVPLIAIAEVCSWYAVLSASNLGHVVEESLWALSAAMLVASLITMWPRCEPRLRPMLAVGCAVGAAYVAFMLLVDVPMYWSRWVADEASGHVPLNIAAGVLRAAQHCIVSHRWQDWENEIPWMSMYFSVAVWLSIAYVHVPALQPSLGGGARDRRSAGSH